MTIIEVEGENVKPLVVDSLDIFAGTRSLHPLVFELIDTKIGQRYSVVVRRLLSRYHIGATHLLSLGQGQPTCQKLLYASLFPELSQSDLLYKGIRSLPPGRDFSNLNNLAILRYKGAPKKNPTVDPTVNIPVSQKPLVETDLHVSVLQYDMSTMPMFLPSSLSRLLLW
jgi:hypothetical protein